MKFIWYFAVHIFVASASLADPMTVSSLRQAVSERDFEAVDAGLSEAQSAYLDGTRTADEIRELFIALSRSEPQTVTFVADWLKHDPDNAKAQIARAWSIYSAADMAARAQNEISFEVAHGMYDAVYDLAYAAYLTEPDLIPASDAMARGFGDNRDTTYFWSTALEAVQTTRPNWGSVLRSLHMMSQQSADMTKTYCTGMSEDFPDREASKIAHRCLMTAAILYGRTRLRPYIEKYLWDDSDPELTIMRLQYFLTRFQFAEATEEQIEWAKTTLLTYPADQFELVTLASLAHNLEAKLRSQHGFSQFFAAAFAKARLPLTEAYLAHDPYNLDLIDMVEGVAFEPDLAPTKIFGGGSGYRTVQSTLTPQQKKTREAQRIAQNADFKKRRLRASPYHAGFWLDYAMFARNRAMPLTLFDGDAAMRNAIIYSADPASVLRQAVNNKQFQYMKFGQYDLFNKDQLAQMPDWGMLRNRTNVPSQLLCPYLRVRLLRGKICEYYPEDAEQCGPSLVDDELQSIELHERAMKAPECAGLLDASIEQLWFTEVPFGEATIQDD